MINNKKAQNLPISTIILIILGVVILVALIIGFTRGWSNFMPWLAPSNNIDMIKAQCASACATGNQATFCSQRVLKYSNAQPMDVGSCEFLATRGGYGIQECSAISCPKGSTPLPSCNTKSGEGGGTSSAEVCTISESKTCPSIEDTYKEEFSDTTGAGSGKICCKKHCVAIASDNQ